jgi:hypothetical protein
MEDDQMDSPLPNDENQTSPEAMDNEAMEE